MRRLMLVGLLLLGAGVARPAAARSNDGRLALGAAQTLGGVSGIDLVRWFGKVGLNATLGAELVSPEQGDSAKGVALALGGLYPIASADDAELTIGGRVDLAYFSRGDQSATQIDLELPLRVEWWLAEALSLSVEVGVVVELVPAEGRVLGSGANAEGTGLSLGDTGLVGGAGFHFYF